MEIEMEIRVEGKIIMDGVESEFSCSLDESWQQWGATTDRLCESTPLVEAIAKAIWSL